MKQNICELDTMIFFREALEAHEFMLLPVMASAVVECLSLIHISNLIPMGKNLSGQNIAS